MASSKKASWPRTWYILGPQHLLDVAAGGRGRSHEHFSFFMRRLFQEIFFPGVEGQGDD